MEANRSIIVETVLGVAVQTLRPDEPVMMARRIMQAQPARSLLVVEWDRPIGLIRWCDVSRAAPETPVYKLMRTTLPVLRRDMPLSQATAHLRAQALGLDYVPVVDERGLLVGVVPSERLTKRERLTTSATKCLSGAAGATNRCTRVHLERGMLVLGANGHKLGLVAAIELNGRGQIAHITVTHGLLRRRVTRVPADVIRTVSDASVRLTVGQAEFKRLAQRKEKSAWAAAGY